MISNYCESLPLYCLCIIYLDSKRTVRILDLFMLRDVIPRNGGSVAVTHACTLFLGYAYSINIFHLE